LPARPLTVLRCLRDSKGNSRRTAATWSEPQLESADVVFLWGENDRLALALHAAVRRSDADAAALDKWAARWVAAHTQLWSAGPHVNPRQFALVENAKQVMRSLHAALSMDGAPTPTGEAAAKTLLAALAKMR
jgi:hypothetical protein